MRVPVNWLKEYVKIDETVEELAHLLNMGGLGVEEIRGEGDDAVLVLEVTSNRGDCLSIVGVAREVAALTGQELKYPSCEVPEEWGPGSVTERASVEILDPDLCPRYAARLITGVRVAESPDWLKARLEAGGLRPINNIVDVTNYVLLELGQPLHAFDFATLQGEKIVVRRARAGETLITIDGLERDLAEEMLVIADAERPVAIAGVMGGLATEVTDQTVDILLESAHFNPTSVRRTRTKIGMSTEASYRFERWVDPSGPVRTANRAAQLMSEVSGGSVLPGVIDIYPKEIKPVKLFLRPSFVNDRLGTNIASKDVQEMLRSLEFAVSGEDPIECVVPTTRNDILIETDLVEEVARLFGYDNIPTTIPSGVSHQAGEGPRKRLERRARELMVRCGLQEVWTFSLTRPAAMESAGVGNGAAALQLRNPLTEDYTLLRTSMIPGIVEVLSNNAKVGNADVHIFEIGKIYLPKGDDKLPEERNMLAVAAMGSNWSGSWGLDRTTVQADFYALKGILTHLLEDFGVKEIGYRPVAEGNEERGSAKSLHPGRRAEVIADGIPVAILGEIHPMVADTFDLAGRAYLATLNLDALSATACLTHRYQSLLRYPAIDRDISMILRVEVAAEIIGDLIRETGGDLVESVTLFDVYQGNNIEVGKRSLAYSLNFRSPDRTLTDEEVDGCLAHIKDALREKLGAAIREG
ncbi:MAG: phenylalanine--tRNA ligase subunit beta [Armatimonadetes bacterium]|nr:phenylalanine--tRNA ligase subunit beta [Armatimonadota bacterium]